MTVAELIAKLKEFPNDAVVYTAIYGSPWSHAPTDVDDDIHYSEKNNEVTIYA